MKNILIVVDMQKDFIYGSLGNEQTKEIVPAVVKKMNEFQGEILFTKDTHEINYLKTQEGKNLPVEHCITHTEGWELIDELNEFQKKRNHAVYEKGTFGSTSLAEDLVRINQNQGIASIELIGVCTDICVVSNALLIKAFLPEVLIRVDSSCCAGVTPQKHTAALETMRSCQINVY